MTRTELWLVSSESSIALTAITSKTMPFSPSVGDVIQDKSGSKAKVLAVLGDVFLRSCWGEPSFDLAGYWHTFAEAEEDGCSVVKEEKPWPSVGDEYYYLGSRGNVSLDAWEGDTVDRERRDFFGVWRTEAEAIAKRDMIKGMK